MFSKKNLFQEAKWTRTRGGPAHPAAKVPLEPLSAYYVWKCQGRAFSRGVGGPLTVGTAPTRAGGEGRTESGEKAFAESGLLAGAPALCRYFLRTLGRNGCLFCLPAVSSAEDAVHGHARSGGWRDSTARRLPVHKNKKTFFCLLVSFCSF